ncbi:MAG: threonylcarbamoyl-AMP synthase [Thermoplasmata archaeon]|nr:threonylcarbamoyl-AMP synthase [Thermoplasmata archaeon]
MILPCGLKSVEKIAEYAKIRPVIIPTDTLYGLCMSIHGDISKVYKLKRRDLSKPIPIGVANLKMMKSLVFLSETAKILINRFMPGPLTLVLKAKKKIFGWDKIAVRIPNHPIPLALMERIGPITLTSANISGEKNPVTIEDTMKIEVKYRIDCGKLEGKPSTVVDLTEGINLIREGAIPYSQILKVLEE